MRPGPDGGESAIIESFRRTDPLNLGSSLDLLSSNGLNPGGYSLWVFRSGSWELMRSSCPEGYLPGGPPSQAGQFEGEVVRKHCEPDLRPAGPPPAGK